MTNAISLADFQKLDIRIGTVVEAVVPEWSHWVMKLLVDFGDEIGKRTIFAGIMRFYQPDDLIGKQFPFVVNIESKKIGPREEDGKPNYSEGMMLAAGCPTDKPDEDAPVLFRLWHEVPAGAKVR